MTSINEIIYFYHPSSQLCKDIGKKLKESSIPITPFKVSSKNIANTLKDNNIIGVPSLMVIFGDKKVEIFNGLKGCNQIIDYIVTTNSSNIESPEEPEIISEEEEFLSDEPIELIEESAPATDKVDINAVLKKELHDRERVEKNYSRKKKA